MAEPVAERRSRRASTAVATKATLSLIEQEASAERYIDIPEEVREVYKLWRPSPLYRARRLEKALGTPARIYYKYEGTSPAGSHKSNTAVPQAYYNAREGVQRITTETGAGQWGSAMSFACAQFGLELDVWQVAASFTQKPYRGSMIRTWGATIHSSPSELTERISLTPEIVFRWSSRTSVTSLSTVSGLAPSRTVVTRHVGKLHPREEVDPEATDRDRAEADEGSDQHHGEDRSADGEVSDLHGRVRWRSSYRRRPGEGSAR